MKNKKRNIQDAERERQILRRRFVSIGGVMLVMILVLALTPQVRKQVTGYWKKMHSPQVTVTAMKSENTGKVKTKKLEEGKNKVDYSVVHGTVTTVRKETPGQQFLDSKETWNTYRGFSFCLTLPEGMKPEEFTFQDDYMKKTLTISFPLEYYEEMREHQLEGLMSNIKKISYKKKVDCARLKITFAHTYAFHYCIEDNILYVKYGFPSYYYDQIVVIDPGHGGVDYGAYTWNQSYIEKKIVLAVTENLICDFEKQDKVMVYYTRADDTGVALADRIGLANEIGADLFVSLHCNYLAWGRAYGVETAYNEKDNGESYNSEWLAKKMQDAFCESMGLYNRGLIKGGDLRVLRLANMPACLLEMGFISDGSDATVLSDPQKQQLAATTIETVIYEALEEMK